MSDQSTKGDELPVHLRLPREVKARWVRLSRAEGKTLTDWIVEHVEQAEQARLQRLDSK